MNIWWGLGLGAAGLVGGKLVAGRTGALAGGAAGLLVGALMPETAAAGTVQLTPQAAAAASTPEGSAALQIAQTAVQAAQSVIPGSVSRPATAFLIPSSSTAIQAVAAGPAVSTYTVGTKKVSAAPGTVAGTYVFTVEDTQTGTPPQTYVSAGATVREAEPLAIRALRK